MIKQMMVDVEYGECEGKPVVMCVRFHPPADCCEEPAEEPAKGLLEDIQETIKDIYKRLGYLDSRRE